MFLRFAKTDPKRPRMDGTTESPAMREIPLFSKFHSGFAPAALLEELWPIQLEVQILSPMYPTHPLENQILPASLKPHELGAPHCIFPHQAGSQWM